MISEPSWSKRISNTTVCTWFYALALINAFVAIAGIVSILFVSKKLDMGVFITLVLSSFIGFTNTWFLFLVCERGLKV